LPWLEDSSNLEPFTPRNRWRQLLEPMRAEAQALDRHLWETHLQVAELAAFRDRQVASWRGARWELAPERPALLLARHWTEAELRWALEAAARACGWPREPELLRGLSAWILPILEQKSRKCKSWGGWTLARAPEKTARPAHGAQPGQGLLLPWVLQRQADP
jgi:hypothetical protein